MGKALMVQGTGSFVGKSTLVAGLCRVFRDQGLMVAPFKAQNMALNSFVTPDGSEIGRAQAVQAEAAGVSPRSDMNPILLKPEAEARAQVIVDGRVWANLSAAEYQRRKQELWPRVEASLRRLLAEFDLVVIEGAGSPAEINLKAHDIANMRVAALVQAPVLLVGDIERGGVFAALVGTMELLEEAERELIAGIVINKFRGDPALLQPGLSYLEERLARPVVGVVPWIEGLGLAEEDSQGLPGSTGRSPAACLDVAVIRVPHIANFDEFAPLARRSGVALRYVEDAAFLEAPDLLILPGTKTTRADLAFLRERNLDRAIADHARRGGALLGICGGYQMLGNRIDDPEGVEGTAGSTAGLGLLPATSYFAAEKATVQVYGEVMASEGLFGPAHGTSLSAYEIHMGRTEADGPPLFALGGASDGPRQEGVSSADGWVAGTYLHGLFESREVREAVLLGLSMRKGTTLPPERLEDDPYDQLARVLSEHLDLERIRAMAGV